MSSLTPVLVRCVAWLTMTLSVLDTQVTTSTTAVTNSSDLPFVSSATQLPSDLETAADNLTSHLVKPRIPVLTSTLGSQNLRTPINNPTGDLQSQSNHADKSTPNSHNQQTRVKTSTVNAQRQWTDVSGSTSIPLSQQSHVNNVTKDSPRPGTSDVTITQPTSPPTSGTVSDITSPVSNTSQCHQTSPCVCEKDYLRHEQHVWTSEDVWRLWYSTRYERLATFNFSMSYSQNGSYPFSHLDTPGIRWLELIIPDLKGVFVVEVGHQQCTWGNYITFFDAYAHGRHGWEYFDWTGCETVTDTVTAYQTSEMSLSIGISIGNFSVPYSFQLSVRAMDYWSSPLRTKMHVFYQTPKLGFVQTMMWNPLHGHYVSQYRIRASTDIRVPEDHMTLFSHTGRYTDKVGILVCTVFRGRQEIKKLWLSETYLPALASLYNITRIKCACYVAIAHNLGYKAIFSYHQSPSIPEQTSVAQWNCSVSFWDDFKGHFLCNKLTECEELEDEHQCNYTQCRPGVLLIRGICFKLNRPIKYVSYNEADRLCQHQDGRLASLSSHRKLTDVTKAFYPGYSWRVFAGLRTVFPGLPFMYKYSHQWEDFIINYHTPVRYSNKQLPACGVLNSTKDTHPITFFDCNFNLSIYFLCELNQNVTTRVTDDVLTSLSPPVADLPASGFASCPSKHMTHTFLECDSFSECWEHSPRMDALTMAEQTRYLPAVPCAEQATSRPPSFTCNGGIQRVPYTLVCDWRRDCQDGSDEDFCLFPPCGKATPLQCGHSPQCYSLSQWCDMKNDCVNNADEATCDLEKQENQKAFPPPAVINFDGLGRYTITPIKSQAPETTPGTHTPRRVSKHTNDEGDPGETNRNPVCEETHFQCADDGYCLPVYTRCNSVADCPGREDEAQCDSYTCAGFYRCRGSKVCLHPSQLCDGWPQCPQRDDELLCAVSCPLHCTCQGLAFTCLSSFPSHLYPQLRYLDAGGSGLTPSQLKGNDMLIHLSLRGCYLVNLNNLNFPNLRSVDLRDNMVTHIAYNHIIHVNNLQILLLAGNPLSSVFMDDIDSDNSRVFPSLLSLDLSNVTLPFLDVTPLSRFTQLRQLNVCYSHVQRMQVEGFQPLKMLRVLDLRGCLAREFTSAVFQGLEHLQAVYTDDYKLCCPALLPEGFDVSECSALESPLSSCQSLLRPSVHQRLYVLLACLSMVGNMGSIVLRVILRKDGCLGESDFSGVFITHLSVSDLLMGMYQVIISVADRVYQGGYATKENVWGNSFTCTIAGILAHLSKLASLCFVSLITVDFVLKDRLLRAVLTSSKRQVHKLCAGVWITGVVLAALPAVTFYRHIYQQTAVCSPLALIDKFTGTDYPEHVRHSFAGESSVGDEYSMGVNVVLSLILLSITALGQLSLYHSRFTCPLYFMDASFRSQSLVLARRSCLLSFVHCLLFIPVCVLTIQRYQGQRLSNQNVSLLFLVIWPMTSALNPYLCGLEMVRERHRHERKQQLMKRLKLKGQQKEGLRHRQPVSENRQMNE